MNRTLIVCLFLFLLGGCEPPAKVSSPPNILFIFTDDQRFDMLGVERPELKTPVMDRLARTGTRFTQAFVTTPICAASRASFLTGTVERTHGYTFGTPPLFWDDRGWFGLVSGNSQSGYTFLYDIVPTMLAD